MKSPATVKELFAPLDKRLKLFEAKRHGNDYSDPSTPWSEFIDRTHIIFRIAKSIGKFEKEEVIDISRLYEIRVAEVFRNLKPVSKVAVQFDLNDVIERAVTDDEQIMMMERWQQELSIYLEQLQVIKKASSAKEEHLIYTKKHEVSLQTPAEHISSLGTQIQLPENFTVKQLNKYFEPQLSINQVALFLYYLKDQAIMPPYSDSSIGKLAEAFFVRNQKNVTKGLTDIYTIKQNAVELSSLKRVLQKLLKEIDNDLKEAR